MTTRLLVLALALMVLASSSVSVHALPTGASACPANEAAVGGSHLGKTERTNGALADNAASLQVKLNGNALSTDTPMDVPVGVDITIELTGASPFRGFLFRLGGDNTTEALKVADGDAETVKVAERVCVTNENVGGLTHTNNVEKTSVKGIMRIPPEAAGNLPLDVTVVVKNQGTVSDYAYSQYTLNAVEGASLPTASNGDGGSSAGISRTISSASALAVVTWSVSCLL